MSFLLYCLTVFFWFYLLNCSDIAAPVRDKVYPKLHANVVYALGCAFCYTAWVSIAAFMLSAIPLGYVCAAPVVNLFLSKVSTYLEPAP